MIPILTAKRGTNESRCKVTTARDMYETTMLLETRPHFSFHSVRWWISYASVLGRGLVIEMVRSCECKSDLL